MAGPSGFVQDQLPGLLDIINIASLVSASVVVVIVIILGKKTFTPSDIT